MAIHSSILAWKAHGQRNLAGYSPWGRKGVGHELTPEHEQEHSGVRALFQAAGFSL